MTWVESEDWWVIRNANDTMRAVLFKPGDIYPQWTVRYPYNAAGVVDQLQLDPSLSLDEAKLVVQTLVGANT